MKTLVDAVADMKVIMAGMPRGPIRDMYHAMVVHGLKKEFGKEPVALALKEWEEGV